MSTIIEPLNNLTRQDTELCWGEKQKIDFQTTKKLLQDDTILVNFVPSCLIGISCDSPDVGPVVVLFHRYPDGFEKPIANAYRTLTIKGNIVKYKRKLCQ